MQHVYKDVINIFIYRYLCACVRACVRACMRACVCVTCTSLPKLKVTVKGIFGTGQK